jgi:sialic acid synthase SpsE|tara:strand:+ start:3247 stop:4296 length:1050 start_codon:yes stop_codon:yes gene_type:complete
MFNIGKVSFTKDKTVIIAEAGVNHIGEIDNGKRLIDEAKNAGADIIKFQTYKAEKLTTKDAPRFWDWDGEKDKEGTQFDSYSNLDSFGREEHKILLDYANEIGIEFMSTPFDNDSADMLVELGMKGFKVASCDLTNIPFIKYLAKKNLPMLISTGAAEINEIHDAVKAIEEEGNNKILIMQCTLCYPTDPKDANLNFIHHIQSEFPNYMVGLSDHTLGNLVASASVLYGVSAIEKHFTYDKTLPDSADHWLSLDAAELKELVENTKILNSSKGGMTKKALECEGSTHMYARRSIVSSRLLKANEIITEDMISYKRPGTGISPKYYKDLIGKRVLKDVPGDSLIQETDFE